MTQAKQQELIPHVEGKPMAVASSPSLLEILDRALSDKAVDVEKMSKIMDLYERVEDRKAEQAFAVAMADAQTDMEPVRADANNSQTKSKYATYPALDRAIRPIYSRHGFAVTYNTGEGAPADHLRVVATVMHRGGHSRDYHMDMPADGKGAKGGDVMTKTHATGSAFTYGKRYVLGGIFNIVITDDDGNGASTVTGPINQDQLDHITTLITETDADIPKFCKYMGVNNVAEIPAKKYQAAVQALKKKAQK